MGNYYFNEKKGIYEPIKDAPFGVAPRRKRDRNVFTAESYLEERSANFSGHYKPSNNSGDFMGSSKSGANQRFNLDSLVERVGNYAQNSSTTAQKASGNSTYASPRTTSGAKGAQAKKKKSSLSWIWIIGIIIFGIMRNCAD